MAQPANPLRLEEVTIGMKVAVYFPGIKQGKYGEVKGTARDNGQDRVFVDVYHEGKAHAMWLDLALIVPWRVS